MEREQVAKWISDHPLFSINGMCQQINIDTSNFMKYLNKGTVPIKHLDAIKATIKEYGYVETVPPLQKGV